MNTDINTDINIEALSHRLCKAYLVKLIKRLQTQKRECFQQSQGLIESYKQRGEENRSLREENRSLRERLERIAELASKGEQDEQVCRPR